MIPQNLFMNQSNNLVNFGGCINNPTINYNNNNNFNYNNNDLIAQPFPKTIYPMMNNNLMFPLINFNFVNPNPMQNNQNMFNSQIQNFFNNNTEIVLNFRFMTNPISFKVKTRQTEKLIDIIERFKQNECPKELIDYLSVCACNGNRGDKNKTLFELGINNGDNILFMDKFTGNDQTVYTASKNNEYVLTEKEKVQYNRLKSQYETRLMIKSAFKNKFVLKRQLEIIIIVLIILMNLYKAFLIS